MEILEIIGKTLIIVGILAVLLYCALNPLLVKLSILILFGITIILLLLILFEINKILKCLQQQKDL